MRHVRDYDKKQLFNRIWFKQGNSPVRDRLKSKLQQRKIEPTEKNAFEYWMGYIRPWDDGRGNIQHINPFRNEAFMRSIGRNKYGTPFKLANRNKKKKRRFKR